MLREVWSFDVWQLILKQFGSDQSHAESSTVRRFIFWVSPIGQDRDWSVVQLDLQGEGKEKGSVSERSEIGLLRQPKQIRRRKEKREGYREYLTSVEVLCHHESNGLLLESSISVGDKRRRWIASERQAARVREERDNISVFCLKGGDCGFRLVWFSQTPNRSSRFPAHLVPKPARKRRSPSLSPRALWS